MNVTGVGNTTQAEQTVTATGNIGEVICIRLLIVPVTTITLPITLPQK
jgi:hypothetical protein